MAINQKLDGKNISASVAEFLTSLGASQATPAPVAGQNSIDPVKAATKFFEFELQLRELNSEIASLGAAKALADAEVTNLRSQLEAIPARIEGFENRINEINVNFEAEKLKVKDAENAKVAAEAKVTETEGALGSAKMELSVLQNRIKEMETELEALRTQLGAGDKLGIKVGEDGSSKKGDEIADTEDVTLAEKEDEKEVEPTTDELWAQYSELSVKCNFFKNNPTAADIKAKRDFEVKYGKVLGF